MFYPTKGGLEKGVVALGHVALDGTKVNAGKHKTMSYDRMVVGLYGP